MDLRVKVNGVTKGNPGSEMTALLNAEQRRIFRPVVEKPEQSTLPQK